MPGHCIVSPFQWYYWWFTELKGSVGLLPILPPSPLFPLQALWHNMISWLFHTRPNFGRCLRKTPEACRMTTGWERTGVSCAASHSSTCRPVWSTELWGPLLTKALLLAGRQKCCGKARLFPGDICPAWRSWVIAGWGQGRIRPPASQGGFPGTGQLSQILGCREELVGELCHECSCQVLSWQQSRISACGGCRAVAPDAPDPFCPLALLLAWPIWDLSPTHDVGTGSFNFSCPEEVSCNSCGDKVFRMECIIHFPLCIYHTQMSAFHVRVHFVLRRVTPPLHSCVLCPCTGSRQRELLLAQVWGSVLLMEEHKRSVPTGAMAMAWHSRGALVPPQMGWGDRGKWSRGAGMPRWSRALLESVLGICLLAPRKSGFHVWKGIMRSHQTQWGC